MAVFYGTLPFFLCYIFLISSPTGSSLSDAEALMQLKKSFTNTKVIDSWGNSENPCAVNVAKWPGILCENGAVTNIHLEDMGLSGKIDVQALLEMKTLRVVSFEGNAFSGPIPELNKLGALKGIYLSRNKFSGEIPSDFFKGMGSLKRIWLDGNIFTGNIPSSLSKLADMTELHLENNKFSGQIPILDVSKLNSFDLSNNNLEGQIPLSLSKFKARSFQGNPGLCGDIIGKKCQNNHSEPTKKSSSVSVALMALALTILVIVIVAIILLKRQQKKFSILEKESLDGSVEGGSGTHRPSRSSNRRGLGSSKRGSMSQRAGNSGVGTGDLVLVNEDKGVFGLADLMKAGAEVLGTGTMGSSYKATMSNGMTVVVKRIKDMNKVGRDGFDTEIRKFGRLRHPNVLAPLAYHYRKEEKLLVSEFAPKGNLLYLLHGDRGPNHAELTWPTRLKIVGGITRGLYYLHNELSSTGLPHGNLKSSNVLLVSGFEPLLVDYGFISLLNSQQATQAIHAYKTPEAETSYQVSPKSDIYCFGIIVLEILTGKSHNNYSSATGKGGIDIAQWVRSAVSDGRESEVLDPEVLDETSFEQMEKLLHLGAGCVERSPDNRPDAREALRKVEEIERECVRTHGYGGPQVRGSHLSHVQSGSYGSGRRLEGVGARSERRNSDNLAFDIS